MVRPLGWRPVGTTEVAVLLGVADQTVRNWAAKRKMPESEWVVGGRPVWRSDVVLRWAADSGRLEAGSDGSSHAG